MSLMVACRRPGADRCIAYVTNLARPSAGWHR
jgi:hypothetical protein